MPWVGRGTDLLALIPVLSLGWSLVVPSSVQQTWGAAVHWFLPVSGYLEQMGVRRASETGCFQSLFGHGDEVGFARCI